MSRSGLTHWVRGAVVALLGATAIGLGARPAVASGCHAPERPVLGLTFRWQVPEVATLAALDPPGALAPAYVPVPCSGETPGSNPRLSLPEPAACAAWAAVVPPNAAPRPFPPPAPPPSAREGGDRIDRPPRAGASERRR